MSSPSMNVGARGHRSIVSRKGRLLSLGIAHLVALNPGPPCLELGLISNVAVVIDSFVMKT